MKHKKAVIFGLNGTKLSNEERLFFKEANPLGFIFFKRNIESKDGLKSLINDLKETLDRDDVLFLIDQEGGRVQRIKEPLTINYPSAKKIGEVFDKDNKKGLRFSYLTGNVIGIELKELGINVNCAPVLDLSYDGASDVIGDRAFSKNPDTVKKLATEYAKGLIDAGVTPIIKHIPGHGRSMQDTHKNIAIVNAKINEMIDTDFIPFNDFELPCFAMMSHIIYSDIDAKKPATLSKKVRKFLKDQLGFQGLVISDDFSMQGLTKFDDDFENLAKNALKNGVDIVLHCNGDMNEMKKILPSIKNLCNRRKKIIRETMAEAKLNNFDEIKDEYKEFLSWV